MKISIVIPVYNEADVLAACLNAIANLSFKPFEVIVVDNNSSDGSMAIAKSYPFVRLISEPKQGVIHARTTGFNAAKGDLIARIDADTIVPTDWLEQLELVFADSSVDASSGEAHYYNVAAAQFFDSLDLFFRRRLSRKLGDRIYLWGSNMAIRRSAWENVRSLLCNVGGMHEDFDIAIHLQEIGGKVTFDERLSVQVSSRRIDANYSSVMHYVWLSPKTYAMHGIKQRKHMYPVVAICAIGYLPARLLHRGYDPELDRFSLSCLFEPKTVMVRVDPTANVI